MSLRKQKHEQVDATMIIIRVNRRNGASNRAQAIKNESDREMETTQSKQHNSIYSLYSLLMYGGNIERVGKCAAPFLHYSRIDGFNEH